MSLVIILVVTAIFKLSGMNLSEAFYLSVLGLIALGYVVTSWRLRREG
jgi:hypothetical protein